MKQELTKSQQISIDVANTINGTDITKLKQYHIFHCVDLAHPLDSLEETEKRTRQYAGFVNARSLEEAFKLSQNMDAGNWNGDLNPQRSTSVGDLIQDDIGFYMVMGVGFKYLFGNHDEYDSAD